MEKRFVDVKDLPVCDYGYPDDADMIVDMKANLTYGTENYNKLIDLLNGQDHKIAVLEKTLQLIGREVLFLGDCGHDDLVNKFINEFKQQAEEEMKNG